MMKKRPPPALGRSDGPVHRHRQVRRPPKRRWWRRPPERRRETRRRSRFVIRRQKRTLTPRTQDAIPWKPRNPLEKRLGRDNVLVLERAERGDTVTDGDVERALDRIFHDATSVSPYRPFTIADRDTYRSIAMQAAVECLRGERPGRRRTASLVAYIRNAMQTEIKASRKAETDAGFTPAGAQKLFAALRGDASPHATKEIDPPKDDGSRDLSDVDRAEIQSGRPITVQADEIVYVDAGRGSDDLGDAADEPMEDVGAEINSTDGDERSDDKFGAAFVSSRPGKRPRFWSLSAPALPDIASDPLTTVERRRRTAHDRELTDDTELDRLVAKAARWQPGDPRIRTSLWHDTRVEQFRSRSLAALGGGSSSAALRQAAGQADMWLRRARRQTRVVPEDAPPPSLKGWIGLASESPFGTGTGVDAERVRRQQAWVRAELQGKAARDRSGVRRGVRAWTPAIQRVYAAATPREQALYDALFVKRGEHGKVGFATLEDRWGEGR